MSTPSLSLAILASCRDADVPGCWRRLDSAPESFGVLAVDFELAGVSAVLNSSLAGGTSWAFIVERSGPSAGKLIGTSFGAALLDDNGDRSSATSTFEQHESQRASAQALASDGWPAQFLTNTVPGERSSLSAATYEAVSTLYTLGGLDWLLV